MINAGPLTMFAPNNSTFEKRSEGALENLVKPENKENPRNIITFHTLPGSYTGQGLTSKAQWVLV